MRPVGPVFEVRKIGPRFDCHREGSFLRPLSRTRAVVIVIDEADAAAAFALLVVNSGDSRLVRECRSRTSQNSSDDQRRTHPFEAIHCSRLRRHQGINPTGYFADSVTPSIDLSTKRVRKSAGEAIRAQLSCPGARPCRRLSKRASIHTLGFVKFNTPRDRYCACARGQPSSPCAISPHIPGADCELRSALFLPSGPAFISGFP